MQVQFDTCVAIMVRRAITLDKNIDELNVDREVVNEWKQSRASFLIQIRNPQAHVVDVVLSVFQGIWKSLSQLPIDNRLYLPPLYQNSLTLTNLLKYFIGELVSRENGSLLQSGNMILNGVQGTGKTTLLKAIVIAVAICCEKFFFVYHNYKDGLYSSGQLITECVHRFVHGKCDGKFEDIAAQYSDDTHTCLKTLSDSNCYIGIAADEIQHVIVIDERLSRRIAVMKSLEGFARTELHHVFLILSGSSANLIRLLFRSMRPESLQNFDFDLNASLCQRYYVPANRTVQSLQFYISDRYPHKEFTDSDIRTMLMATGGIGRFVHNYVQNPIAASINSGRKADPRTLYADPATLYFLIANLIVSVNSELFDSLKNSAFDGLDRCPGVSKKIVEDVLAEIGQCNADAVINNLVDQGVLYVSDDGPLDDMLAVELAVPQDYQLFATDGVSFNDYTLFAASLLMIYGGIENNAGKAFERFVRFRLHHLNYRFRYRGRYLVIIDGILYIGQYADAKYSKERSSQGEVVVDIDTFGQDELLAWEGEIGLDGVCIRVDRVDDKSTVTVDGWQCKGGHWCLQMGGGAIKTTRDCFLESGTVENVSDKQLNGILAKAEVGFLTIVQSICNTIPNCSITIGQLMLNTTKCGMIAQKSLERCYTIPQSMVSKFPGICAGQHTHLLSYSVLFYDKDQWLRDVLINDRRLLLLLPPRSAVTDVRRHDGNISRCIVC